MSNKEDIKNPETEVSEVENTNESLETGGSLTLEEQIIELNEALANAEANALSNKDAALRSKAETENIRRRTEKEVSNASKFALERFAKEILGVVDSLEKALELPVEDESQKAMYEGIELTYKLMVDTLKKFSIEQISPLGEHFDPALHEAMIMQESEEHEPNSVMMVIQPGYQLNGRLIRPARVIVAKGKAPSIDENA
ncbi:MAG: molecular chaperone GrpE [Polaribacter sp.]|jgi:molecular chaperone GrpE